MTWLEKNSWKLTLELPSTLPSVPSSLADLYPFAVLDCHREYNSLHWSEFCESWQMIKPEGDLRDILLQLSEVRVILVTLEVQIYKISCWDFDRNNVKPAYQFGENWHLYYVEWLKLWTWCVSQLYFCNIAYLLMLLQMLVDI